MSAPGTGRHVASFEKLMFSNASGVGTTQKACPGVVGIAGPFAFVTCALAGGCGGDGCIGGCGELGSFKSLDESCAGEAVSMRSQRTACMCDLLVQSREPPTYHDQHR